MHVPSPSLRLSVLYQISSLKLATLGEDPDRHIERRGTIDNESKIDEFDLQRKYQTRRAWRPIQLGALRCRGRRRCDWTWVCTWTRTLRNTD